MKLAKGLATLYSPTSCEVLNNPSIRVSAQLMICPNIATPSKGREKIKSSLVTGLISVILLILVGKGSRLTV